LKDKMSSAKAVVQGLRESFNSGRIRSAACRRVALNQLLEMLETEEEAISTALAKDLRKPEFESVLMELDMVRNAVRGLIYDFEGWMADEYVEKNLVTLLDTTFIRKEPKGVALVIGAWNYPVQLTICPLAAAIAAGNTVLLKPSELAPETSAVLKRIIESHMDPGIVGVIEGGVSETQDVLKQRFDHIFYTGGSNVGRIIASAAAVHLTPCTLELGGKCPVYIDENINLEVAAMRLIWGKMVNLGQTCVAPDYVLCSPRTEQKLLDAIKRVLPTFYGEEQQKSKHLTRIINDRHFNRLKALTEKTTANLAIGGVHDADDLFLDLHVYTNVQADDALMTDEIFGPILPIVTVESHEQAIEFINAKEKPLSLYIFTDNKSVRESILNRTSSGSVCVNDVIVHLSIETLPFGGVGNSGYGAYHGKDSFDTFSHRKSICIRDFGFIGEKLGEFRYPPYTDYNKRSAMFLLKRRNFRIPTGISAISFVFGVVCLAAAVGVVMSQCT